MLRVLRRAAKVWMPAFAVDYVLWAERHFGIAFALRTFARSLLREDRLVKLPVPGPSRFVFIRPGTSDQDVYQGIFILGEYAAVAGSPRTIIDAGGHIGLASVYFSSRFPEAQIVVIEPDRQNFAMLERNLGGRANVHLHRGGLWSHQTTLDIENPGDSGWEFRVHEGRGIPSFTVDEVAERYGFKRIDLLKIDVEGAEIEVLSSASKWMGRVRMLVIELHDRFRPGCREALDAATQGFGFAEQASGENVVLVREL